MSITAYQVEAVGHDRTGRDFGYVQQLIDSFLFGGQRTLNPQ